MNKKYPISPVQLAIQILVGISTILVFFLIHIKFDIPPTILAFPMLTLVCASLLYMGRKNFNSKQKFALFWACFGFFMLFGYSTFIYVQYGIEKINVLYLLIVIIPMYFLGIANRFKGKSKEQNN